MKIVAIIPARGGSKGIPGKNIKQCAGKPLIAWTIESAKQCKMLNRVIVSTDDKKIAEVAKEYGAEVVDRPAELATDTATTMSALQHVLESVEADIVVLLQCTSPVRKQGLIDYCVNRFIERKDDSLATGVLCKFYEYGALDQRRQDIKGFFYDDGNVYVFKADLLKKGERYGKVIDRVCIDKEQNVEIDDMFEFWLAEKILERYNGKMPEFKGPEDCKLPPVPERG